MERRIESDLGMESEEPNSFVAPSPIDGSLRELRKYLDYRDGESCKSPLRLVQSEWFQFSCAWDEITNFGIQNRMAGTVALSNLTPMFICKVFNECCPSLNNLGLFKHAMEIVKSTSEIQFQYVNASRKTKEDYLLDLAETAFAPCVYFLSESEIKKWDAGVNHFESIRNNTHEAWDLLGTLLVNTFGDILLRYWDLPKVDPIVQKSTLVPFLEKQVN